MSHRITYFEPDALLALEEFRELTDKQKQMCYEHMNYPHLTKGEIAYKLGIAKSYVHNFFHSETWDKINVELARQQVRELTQLAVKTLRDSMLTGTSSVKFEAALRVLINSGLMKPNYTAKTIKQDNKMVVLWNEEPAARNGEESAIRNGIENPLLTAPEAEGDSRIPDQI